MSIFRVRAFADVNLAGASISDANPSKLSISEANLAGASIGDSMTDEMTINGVSVKELFAAYRSQSSRSKKIARFSTLSSHPGSIRLAEFATMLAIGARSPQNEARGFNGSRSPR
jgi:uncharacterized protein YjbI with pentapeptide repeats